MDERSEETRRQTNCRGNCAMRGKPSWLAVVAAHLRHVPPACALLAIAAMALAFCTGIEVFFVSAWPLFGFALSIGLLTIALSLFSRQPVSRLYGSIIAVAISGLAIMLLMAMTMHARARSRWEIENTSKHNFELVCDALRRYVRDHEGTLPLADQWCDLLMQYDGKIGKETFRHPLEREFQCSFALNENVSGAILHLLGDNTVLVFEAKGAWNLAGGAELLGRQESVHGRRHVHMLLSDLKIRTYWFYARGVRSNTSYDHQPVIWEFPQ